MTSRTIDTADAANAVLTIDIGAVVANWRMLQGRAGPAACAAVVKADAYGLGVARIAPALAAAGCRTFFVATLDEGISLRQIIPGAVIAVLGAPVALVPALFAEHRLTPVLNSLADIQAWGRWCAEGGSRHPAMIHVDTGMSRLGLPPEELALLAEDTTTLCTLSVAGILSHLACADDPEDEMNDGQRRTFAAARAVLPPAPASLANSGGIFLGTDYHFDLVRPGIALYGGAPHAGMPNPMGQVIELKGRILQVRQIDSPQTVGYGATHRATRRQRIATIGVGYADGYLRSLSNRGWCCIAGWRAPLVGRVSMDLITFDVSDVPESLTAPGAMVQLIGADYPVDAIAADAGTIPYEILTSLGSRYPRDYIGQAAGDG